MKPQRSILFSMLLLSSSTASPLFTKEEDIRRPGILQIGEHIATHISFDADSEISPVVSQQGDSFKKTYSLTHQGASYIALHFANMDLDASCKIEISDADDQQKYVMTGRGRHNQGMFWARHINGDSIKIDFFCDDWSSKAVFGIDEYVAGFPDAGIGIRNRNLRGQNSRSENPFPPLEGRDGRELTICGTNDMRNAQCYASEEFSTEYNAAKAVAKIIMNGSGVCTGWLVGENNVLITAEHCIQNAQQAMNAEYIFNYEKEGGGDCSRSGVKENSSTEITYEADELIAAVIMDDYALISLTGNPVATHG
jgi:lysyl endopeptidase